MRDLLRVLSLQFKESCFLHALPLTSCGSLHVRLILENVVLVWLLRLSVTPYSVLLILPFFSKVEEIGEIFNNGSKRS